MRGLLAGFVGAFLLSGCGGGGDAAPQQVAAAPAPATKPSILIEAYGDSTMWGQDGKKPSVVQASVTQPSNAQAVLRAGYGQTVTVANEGVPGTTAVNLVLGTDGKHLPWTQQMANSTAQIVVVNFCINDSNPAFKESTETYRAFLSQIVNTARGAGKVIFLVEPNTVDSSILPATAQYVTVMREVAAQLNVPLVANWGYPAVTPDGIHPDAPTYASMGERMAETMWATVGSMLR